MATIQPLDDPSQGFLDAPPLCWGILGCGRVSHDFCLALQHVSSASIVACSTRNNQARAQEFADKHKITHAFGDYQQLVNHPDVDIVYVGNLHNSRRATGEMILQAGKHILLEKPIACSLQDTEYLMELAKSKDLFLLEGMWTRFFPAVAHARQLVQNGTLGDVVNIATDFNFNAADSEEYPTSFVYQRKLGGGASLLTGPYPIAAALLFANEAPSDVKVVGQVDEPTGVDLQAAMALQFQSSVATLSYGMKGESEEITTVVGTKGRLTIATPCHCPTKLLVRIKGEGRGNLETVPYEYPLPEDTPHTKAAGGYFYPNSAGFCYEAAAVARCIAAGKKECPQFTWEDSRSTQKILEEARKQLGIKTVDED